MSNANNTLLRYCLTLAGVAVIAAILVAVVHRATQQGIADQQQDNERQALNQVLPATLHDNDLLTTRFTLGPDTQGYEQLPLLGLSAGRKGYIALRNDAVSGIVLPLEATGYGGPIVLLIGIAADGKITGVRVQQHAETPGLGDSIDIHVSPWITVFDHRNLDDTPEPLWHVKQDGGDFDQFTGATITPRAVVGAVYNALQFFELNKDKLLKQPANKEPR
ncbi:MAG TPA: electron transport complex subunit RsxG [Candidatus Acidoferrum sp.]|nr:electron transport complex subunit RsxG [Candidatus Acidoferrum sp.]